MPDPAHLAVLFAAINTVAFALFGVDKLLAKTGRRRVSEKTLLAVCALAASPGGLLGMVVFNHKTSKPKFRYGVPLLLAAHAATIYWLSFA